MITKFPKVVLTIVFAIVLTIFWAGLALAESPDGMGPDSAMGPGDWITMHQSEKHWFTFHFDYDGKPETVEINLYADPENGATFTVRNAEQVRLWRNEGKDEWFGAGSENKYAKGDLSWAGAFESSGTYYVVVEHNALTPGPTACKLEITGKGVTFPVAAKPVAAPVVMAAEEVAMAAPAMQMGGGPDEAGAPTGEWTPLQVGEQHWYAFDFDYDAKVTEPIEIKIYAEPKDSAVLTVRNAEQAQMWREEGKNEHFGCCTVQTISGDDTEYGIWSGQLFSSGRYYIVVEHAKNITAPATYRYTIEGKNISFPTAKMAPAVEAAPAPAEMAAPVAPVMAPGKIGGGPDEAMAPMTGEWIKLETGMTHWFAFNYDFDKGFDPFQIKIYSNPEKGAVLTVRNEEQAQLWRTEGKNEHFGCCTVETISGDETDYGIWVGRPDSSGTYYIVVEKAKNVDGPVMYNFTIAGEGVSFPTAKMAPAVEAAPALAAAEMPAEPVIVAGLVGGGPDEAMAPMTGEWIKLETGMTHWFAFNYDFDKGFDPFQIKIYSNPEKGAVLTVRNEEQAQLWRTEGKNEHFGCCTVETISGDETDYGIWVGRPDSSGTYYIVVEKAKNVDGPVMYNFTIAGEGVSY